MRSPISVLARICLTAGMMALSLLPVAGQAGVERLHVQGNVWMIGGAGGNIAVQVGPQGLVVVDTGDGMKDEEVLAALRGLSDLPVRYIINTSADLDHTGGNEALSQVGKALPTREIREKEVAQVLAHEKVLLRMSAPTGEKALRPSAAWPNATFFTPEKDLFVNGEAIQLLHQPKAHGDGDIVAFFRRSDVIVTGEVFRTDTYPRFNAERGGSLSGLRESASRLIDLTIPGEKEEGGTMLIPGHGRVADEFDLADYRNMLTIVHDRIQALAKKGMTLAQVKSARPTLQYDGRWGTTTGPWTTETFVEAIYREVAVNK
jgi:glyoxylase-like metal-dependent hydrolase (beta-lactamase superfamily II)